MSNVRLRRLAADHRNLVEYIRQHPRLRLVQAIGDPPEQYQIEYCIKSLRQISDDLKEVKSHLVEISLPRNYPRTPPLCRMLTPVFHPNIAPHAICVGDHWSAGEPLKSIVARIGEMLAYQSYNVKSPLNGEAARWVEQNLNRLPLDEVSLLVEEGTSGGTATVPSPAEINSTSNGTHLPEASASAEVCQVPLEIASFATPKAGNVKGSLPEVVVEEPPVQIRMIEIQCPNCSTPFRLDGSHFGKKARCSQCQTLFQITEERLVQ